MTKSLLLFCSLFVLSEARAELDINALLKKIDPELIKSSKNFKTEGCELQKEKWAGLLFIQTSFIETVKFSKTCDIQGTFTPKVNEFFPLKVKLRNLGKYSQLQTQIKTRIYYAEAALLTVDLKDATLSGKASKKFSLDYTSEIDPLDPNNFIKKSKGGKLILKTSKGNKTYPLN